MPELFPCRAGWRRGLGSTAEGLDADTLDHRSEDVPRPELEVSEPGVVGRLWSPDGLAFREVLDRAAVEFGFRVGR